MNLIAIALLLQLTVALPERSKLADPASGAAVPEKLRKDYNKTWERFLKGKEDQKVLSETESLLKKDRELVPVLMIQFYVHQYAGRSAAAERMLEEVLKLRPRDPFALNALADAAYARNDFVRASTLYQTLLTVDRSSPDLETRSQKSLLLAVQGLLAEGRQALDAGNLTAAEQAYRQALSLAPGQASLHGALAGVLMRQERWEQALLEYERQVQLGGPNAEAAEGMALALKRLGRDYQVPGIADPTTEAASPIADLEELGRWGPDIGRFRRLASSNALTRGEFSWMLSRYFPQLSELPQTRRILTDVLDTGADAEIHTIVGLGLLDAMPNHTFVPDSTLTRRELAQAMVRLSRLLRAFPEAAAAEPAPNGAFADTLPQDEGLAASLGLLASGDPENSDLSAPARGEEAVSAAEKLLALLEEKQP
jgi:Flp pilus assembly protein TadD